MPVLSPPGDGDALLSLAGTGGLSLLGEARERNVGPGPLCLPPPPAAPSQGHGAQRGKRPAVTPCWGPSALAQPFSG